MTKYTDCIRNTLKIGVPMSTKSDMTKRHIKCFICDLLSRQQKTQSLEQISMFKASKMTGNGEMPKSSKKTRRVNSMLFVVAFFILNLSKRELKRVNC